jgi:glycerol uptake facilitator-like aquaporin
VATTTQQKLLAEALGTALLLAVVIGSGVMAERLSRGNAAIALLANTLATVGGLYVLIEMFGPISGAHFNPAVSLVMTWRREMSGGLLAPYVVAQLLGAALGAWLVHAMFDMTILQFSSKVRSGAGQWIAEAVATFGLVLVILRAPAAQSGRHGCGVHRRGVLVHGVDVVRESRGGVRTDVQRQLCRDRTRQRPRVHRRRARRSCLGGAASSRLRRRAGRACSCARERRRPTAGPTPCLT